MRADEIRKTLAELNPYAEFFESMDDALIGYSKSRGSSAVAVYDGNKCIEILMRDGLDVADAHATFMYNYDGYYGGKVTPIIVWSPAE